LTNQRTFGSGRVYCVRQRLIFRVVVYGCRCYVVVQLDHFAAFVFTRVFRTAVSKRFRFIPRRFPSSAGTRGLTIYVSPRFRMNLVGRRTEGHFRFRVRNSFYSCFRVTELFRHTARAIYLHWRIYRRAANPPPPPVGFLLTSNYKSHL